VQSNIFKTAWPFFVLAPIGIIAGGLLSAVTAHAPTQPTSWASAYLVLVVGVASAGLGVGRALLSPTSPSPSRLGTEAACWTVGNMSILFGTLTQPAGSVEIGSALLVVTLMLMILGIRAGQGPRVVRLLFTVLVWILIVSIPIGVLLSHLGR